MLLAHSINDIFNPRSLAHLATLPWSGALHAPSQSGHLSRLWPLFGEKRGDGDDDDKGEKEEEEGEEEKDERKNHPERQLFHANYQKQKQKKLWFCRMW